MMSVLLAGLTGVVQGARHALEPDHVTAVATVMVEAPSPRRGMFYAGCWGVGHASMLILVAGPLVLLRVELPDSLSTALELMVGAMLVYLGVRTLRGQKRTHSHAAPTEDAPDSRTLRIVRRGRRPFAIGIMHGLAGSGALAALLALGSSSVAAGVLGLVLYALGTVVGMVALAALAGPLLARTKHTPKIATSITMAAGVASIIVGVVWAIRTIAG